MTRWRGYATALRLGTADTETLLRRFVRHSGVQHPTYRALVELGKAERTVFLCCYLNSQELRQEIHGGLEVVENWNSANGFIFYGKGQEIATNRLADQEIAMLSLHLLQMCLVYINTLMTRALRRGDRSFPAIERRCYFAPHDSFLLHGPFRMAYF